MERRIMVTLIPTDDFQIVDSRDDSRITYIIFGDCKAPILKAKIKDMCYIMKIVGNVCHLELDSKECVGK